MWCDPGLCPGEGHGLWGDREHEDDKHWSSCHQSSAEDQHALHGWSEHRGGELQPVLPGPGGREEEALCESTEGDHQEDAQAGWAPIQGQVHGLPEARQHRLGREGVEDRAGDNHQELSRLHFEEKVSQQTSGCYSSKLWFRAMCGT